MIWQKIAGTAHHFARLMKFAAWLQALPNRSTPPPFPLLQISLADRQSLVLYAAVRLDIAGVLGEEPLAEWHGQVACDT